MTLPAFPNLWGQEHGEKKKESFPNLKTKKEKKRQNKISEPRNHRELIGAKKEDLSNLSLNNRKKRGMTTL